jgi:uroporphyrinogen decarboxylase
MEWTPNFERFYRTVTTKEPGPVPVGDIYADAGVIANYLGEPVNRWTRDYIEKSVRFYYQNRWDFVTSFSNLAFKNVTATVIRNTSSEVKNGERTWVDEGKGPIENWNDFETFSWPKDIKKINYPNRYAAELIPEGMKVLVIPGGVFEWTTWLLGIVPFSYFLVDQPDLVDAVIEKVAEILYAGIEDLMDEPKIGGVFVGDDMGFNTGTLVSPKVLREKFLPHLKRTTDLVHSAGKVMILHSCGNLKMIMDDLCEIGIDAKHSFEDKIMPVEEVYRLWGEKIALIGGVDINLLALGTEEQIRVRTHEILNGCALSGGYVLGTGNSVADYIPIRNYLVMLDEGRKWNREHFGKEF